MNFYAPKITHYNVYGTMKSVIQDFGLKWIDALQMFGVWGVF